MENEDIQKILDAEAETRDRLSAELEEFDKKLPFTKRMDFFFPQLVNFYESHGHFRVRRVDDEKLYDFNRKLMVKYTRWKYLQKHPDIINDFKLTRNDQVLLEEASYKNYFSKLREMKYGLSLMRNIHESSLWLSKYRMLEDFYNKNEHCLVKTDLKNKNMSVEERTLGQWVALQRVKRIRNVLSTSQIKKLNDINFYWMTDLRNIIEESKNGNQRAIETRANLLSTLQTSGKEYNLDPKRYDAIVEFEGRLHAIEVKIKSNKEEKIYLRRLLDDAAEAKKKCDRQDSKRFQEIEDIIEQLAHQVRKAEAEGDKYADDRDKTFKKMQKISNQLWRREPSAKQSK